MPQVQILTPEGLLYEPNPIQQAFHASNAPYRWYGGAFGGGKTLCIGVEAFLYSQYFPGSRGLVCRWAYTDLVETTWDTLLRIIPEGYLDLPNCNKSRFLLSFKNGSVISGVNLQKERNIRSRNAGWAAIDEITELPDQRMLNEIAGRLRHPGSPNVLFAGGNANGHDWVYDLWHVDAYFKGLPSPDKDYAFFHCKTGDNKFNSPGYEQRLRKLYPAEMVQKLLDGSFEVFEQQAFYLWSQREHVLSYDDLYVLAGNPLWNDLPVYRAIDHGWKSPTCCLWAKVDPEGNYFITDEYWEVRKTISEMCEDIMRQTGSLNVIRTVVDREVKKTSSQTGETNYDYYHRGLGYAPLEESDSEVLPSISTIQELLKIDPNHRHPVTGRMGAPRVYISPRCPNLIREMPGIRWSGFGTATAFKPKLVDGNDHAVSALRYFVQMRPTGPSPDMQLSDYDRMINRFNQIIKRAPSDYLANVIGNETAF
jgi:prepilin-type processing-associated H-X9-DG protein